MPKTVVQSHKQNFDALRRAIRDRFAGLMECELKSTGEKVAVICAFVPDGNGSIDAIPFAMFFNGNPYEMLNPPTPDDGFHRENGL